MATISQLIRDLFRPQADDSASVMLVHEVKTLVQQVSMLADEVRTLVSDANRIELIQRPPNDVILLSKRSVAARTRQRYADGTFASNKDWSEALTEEDYCNSKVPGGIARATNATREANGQFSGAYRGSSESGKIVPASSNRET